MAPLTTCTSEGATSAFTLAATSTFEVFFWLAPAIIAAAVIAMTWKKHSERTIGALYACMSSFALWSALTLLISTSTAPTVTAWLHAVETHVLFIVFMSAVALLYATTFTTTPTWRHYAVVLALYLPLFLFGHTTLNVAGVTTIDCVTYIVNGPLRWFYLPLVFLALLAAVLIAYTRRQSGNAENICHSKYTVYSLSGGLFVLISLIMMYMSTANDPGNGNMELLLAGLGTATTLLVAGLVTKPTLLTTAKIVYLTTTFCLLFLAYLLLIYADRTLIRLIGAFMLLTAVLQLVLLGYYDRNMKQQQRKLETLAAKIAHSNRRLRKVDKLKSEFVSIASHQLRSPLTSIRGHASLLSDGSFGKLPKKASEAVEHIHEASATMATSIEDFLNVSRIESGNMQYDFTDFNFKDEVERVADDKRREAMKGGLLLTFKSQLHKHQGIVNADIGKTRQIIHNLINNAIKYTEQGSIKVQVRAVDAKTIVMEVIDTGIGMNPDDMAVIFEKFGRSKVAHAINHNGAGLGLFIAEQMAKKMGGSITATSEGAGKGSTFVFTLPLEM